jgi:phenylacetate-coenzyme A ligase PaaK-like adenylate-forming protein
MNYYDRLETRDPAVREAELMQALPALIAHARQNTPAFAHILAGVDAAGITSREALARLPVTRKSDLPLSRRGCRSHSAGLQIIIHIQDYRLLHCRLAVCYPAGYPGSVTIGG